MIFDKHSVKERVRAISSKSEAHRYLICASLADRETELICTDTNADINATAQCLNSMGASVTRTEMGFLIKPISSVITGGDLDCNESGSTLRFLLPLAAALGADCRFIMRGRLAARPLSPLYEILRDRGVALSPQGSSPLEIKGKFGAGDYRVAANVSSQYISGLLFALSVSEGESTLRLDGRIESAPYIEMTVKGLMDFGADIEFDCAENIFFIKGAPRLRSPERVVVGGDWSNAAFYLAAGAVGKRSVTVSGLDEGSSQGDREILALLEKMGAKITRDGADITVHPSRLRAIDIDASQIPDLVPVLATVASVAEGKTRIYNAGRLRLKESDRIESVCRTLRALGADIEPRDDGMVIAGKKSLAGGVIDSYNDHRIAMSAAVASLICENTVKITRFEAINKSYPSFLDGWEIKDQL